MKAPDILKYNRLVNRMKTATPKEQAVLWQQLERLKNKYGGAMPQPTLDDFTALGWYVYLESPVRPGDKWRIVVAPMGDSDSKEILHGDFPTAEEALAEAMGAVGLR